MSRLWARLSVAFAVVTFVGLVVGAFFVTREVGRQFRRFVAETAAFGDGQPLGTPRELPRLLAGHYRTAGGWAGVDAFVEDQWRDPLHGPPPIVVMDAVGRVVYPSTLAGDRFGRLERRPARPIQVQGRIVGYVMVRPGDVTLPPLAVEFLGGVNRSILRAGAFAAGLGILLGLLLSRGIAAPLDRLARAARGISRGDLTSRVPETGPMEVADVARAFNEMAAGLAREEELRRNMVSDVAHELRTPLTVIQGSLQAILDGVYPLSKDEVMRIQAEAQHLQRLVEDVGDLARVESGQLKLAMVNFDLAALAEATLATFREVAAGRDIRLVLHVETVRPMVQADPGRTRQVLGNLLDNAVRHTPYGGLVEVSVFLSDGSGDGVGVRVTDSGPGIPLEHLDRVFERMWRGDPARTRQTAAGHGLGLAIARQLVLAQRGTIGVANSVEGGASFWFVLPAATIEAAPDTRKADFSA